MADPKLSPVAGLEPTLQNEELLPGAQVPTGLGRALKSGGYGALKSAARVAEGVAREAGLEGVAAAAEGTADRYAAEAARLAPPIMAQEELTTGGEMLDYYLAHLVSNLPGMGVTAAAGIGGRGIGGRLFKGGARRAAAQVAGGTSGAFASTAIQNIGDIYDEQKEAGVDNFGVAAQYGALAGALDVIAPAAILARVGLKPSATGMFGKSKKQLVTDIMAGVGLGAASEGITEGIQEDVAIRARAAVDPTYDVNSLEAMQRRREAAIVGGAIGGTFGGGGGAARYILRPGETAPRPVAAPADEAPAPVLQPGALPEGFNAEAAFGEPGRGPRDPWAHIMDFMEPPPPPGPIDFTPSAAPAATDQLRSAADVGADRLAAKAAAEQPKGLLRSAREAGLARAAALGRTTLTEEEEHSAARQGNFTEGSEQQRVRTDALRAAPEASRGDSAPASRQAAVQGLRRQAAEVAAANRSRGIPLNEREQELVSELDAERAAAAKPIEVADPGYRTRKEKVAPTGDGITAGPAMPSNREGGLQALLEPAQPSKRGGELVDEGALPSATVVGGAKQVVDTVLARFDKSELTPTLDPRRAKIARARVGALIRKAISEHRGTDVAELAKKIRDSVDEGLANVLPAQDRLAFVDEILNGTDDSPQKQLFSQAARARPLRNKTVFVHWGNVPGGVTDPGMIGAGVPGRDQALAKEFGLNYTSAVTAEAVARGDYVEPAVQARTPYLGVLDTDKLYDWSQHESDPRWEQAKQLVARKYGPDLNAARAQLQKMLSSKYDGIIFPGGQLRLFKPATVYTAPSVAKMQSLASKTRELLIANGGSSVDLATGTDFGGQPFFSISPYKDREVKILGIATEEQIRAYIGQNADALSLPAHVMGTWTDGGYTYLDVAVLERDMQRALAMARDAEQLAIFDLRSFTTIPMNHPVFETAVEYALAAGLPTPTPIQYREVNADLGRRTAATYAGLQSHNQSPEVTAAFQAMAAENAAIVEFFRSRGFVIEEVAVEGQVPYANSAEMRKDVFENKHLWVFKGGNPHPLLTPADIFNGRAAHDLLGHARTGFEFGPRGEFNAFRAESQFYSDKAIPAVAVDSFGQNSWVNFSEPNAGKPITEREFAEQKVDLLPDHLVAEALADVTGQRQITRDKHRRVAAAKGQAGIKYLNKILGTQPTLDVVMFVSDESRPYAGRTSLGRFKDLIELAYNAKDDLSVAAHEGYHFAEERMLNEAQREIVRRAFADGTPLHARVVANAARYDSVEGTSTAAAIKSEGAEARAYGFEQWKRGELEVDGVIAKLFAKIRELIEKVRNYFDHLGFQSSQDIFRALDEGRLAARHQAALKVVDQSTWDTWIQNVEPDVLDGLEHYDSRLARVAEHTPSQEHAKGPLVAKGRPDQIKSRADLERIRARVQALAEEGVKYGAADWHERSAKGAMLLARGDVDQALTMAALISNFSPRTMVGDDLGRALTARTRAERGEPLAIESVRAPGQHIEGAKRILEGEVLTGRKRVSFLKNMMYYLDPQTFHDGVQGATIDMWMAHVFGFANDTSGALKGDAQYDWAEAETFRVANKLGIKAWEVQAAVWVALRARANRVRGVADQVGNRYGWFDTKQVKDPETGKMKDKLVVRPEKVENYLNAWMDASMEVEFDPDAFRESNVSYLEAADKLAMGFQKFRAPAMLTINGKKTKLADVGPVIRAELKAIGFAGQHLAALQPRTMLGQFYSHAAIANVNSQIATGNFERARLFGNVRDAMAAAEVPENTVKGYFGGAIDTGKGVANGIARAYNEWIGSGMAQADRSPGYKNVFNVLSYYDQRKKRLFTTMIDRDLTDWVKHGTTESEMNRVTKVLLDRTINEWQSGSDQLTTALARLTPRERTLFEQATRMVGSALDAEFEVDKATYARLLGPESPAYKQWLKDRGDQVTRLKQTGYFPERRYGDHSVHAYVVDPATGKRITLMYEQYESEGKARHRLNGAPGVPGLSTLFADVDGIKVEYGFRYAPETDGSMSFQQFLDLAQVAGVAFTQAEKERIAKKLIDADSTKMNRLFRRENVPGASEEGLRVLAEMAEVASNRVAYGEFNPAVKSAMAGEKVDVQFNVKGQPSFTVTPANIWREEGPMGGHYRGLADELVTTAMSKRPNNVVSGHLRAFASFQFLGGSIAAAMVNMSSLMLATAPYLSQYVGGSPIAATARVLGGMRMTGANWKNLNLVDLENPAKRMPGIDDVPGLREALRIGLQDGTLQDTEIYQFMGLSRGQLLTKSRARRAAADIWMAPFRMVEKYNRVSSFMAAWEIGREKGMSGQALYTFAQQAVFRSQLRYDEVNRPKLARSGIGAILMTFKTFPLGMLELMSFLAKTDKRAAAFMMGSFVLAAGIEGLPFVEDAEDMVDTIAQRVFGSPWNTKRWMRNTVRQASEAIVGADMSGLVMHGAMNWFTGGQFASRLGLGNIVPGTRMLAADADFKEVALEVVGPVAGMLKGAAEGLGHVTRGDFDKALRAGAPLAIQNLMKGAEQAQRGFAMDSGGRRMVDVTGWETFMQTIGFSSDKLARAYELDKIDRQSHAFLTQVRTELTGGLAVAMRDGDQRKVEQIIGAIGRWNAGNPDYPIILNGASLRKQAALAGLTVNERTLRLLPRALRASSEAYRAYREDAGGD